MGGGRKEALITAPNPKQKQKEIYLQMSWSSVTSISGGIICF